MIQVPPPNTIWPTAVSGWVSLVVSLIGLLGVPIGAAIAYSKFTQTLNNLGERVKKVEDSHIRLETEHSKIDKQLSDIPRLIELAVEGRQVAEAARERIIQLELQHAKVLGEIRLDIQKGLNNITERLQSIETQLRLERPSRGD